MAAKSESLRFLKPHQVLEVRELVGTPCFVYDLKSLKQAASEVLAFPNAFGISVRFAMKASPNAAILKILETEGLHFDCSSTFEVQRAMQAGIPASKLSLSSQELTGDFKPLIDAGIHLNACSLQQLRRFGEAFQAAKLSGQEVRGVGVRLNPGMGSGGTNKTNVGGPAASFGIWHEQVDEILAISKQYDFKIVRVHTHIGSGSDPEVWVKTSKMSLDLVRNFPDATTLNLGGGYKVGRMLTEKTTDLQLVGELLKREFVQFAQETGRELKLEIEPGTYLLANTGCLVTTIQDMTSTGKEGYQFLKLDSGMTELLRPSLYGSQHPIIVVPSGLPTQNSDRNHLSKSDGEKSVGGDITVVAATAATGGVADGGVEASSEEGRGDDALIPFIVVGHCCESGDLISTGDGQPDVLKPRHFSRNTRINDLLVIEGTGAYCSSMSTKNYNSFPEAPELLLAPKRDNTTRVNDDDGGGGGDVHASNNGNDDGGGEFHVIRKRQKLEQIFQNEVQLPASLF